MPWPMALQSQQWKVEPFSFLFHPIYLAQVKQLVPVRTPEFCLPYQQQFQVSPTAQLQQAFIWMDMGHSRNPNPSCEPRL